jgi:hypothetical protein
MPMIADATCLNRTWRSIEYLYGVLSTYHKPMPFFTRLLLAGTFIGVLSLPGHAQKVDLDRFHYEVSYIRLPREYVAPDQRTFGVRVESVPIVSDTYPSDAVYQKISLSGFEKVERDPMVGITIRFTDFRFLKSDIETRTEEVKDKDGKVTGTNYYYRVVASYEGSGSYVIKGPKPSGQAQTTPTEAAPANRFLAKASAASQEAQSANVVTVASRSLFRGLSYRSGEYRSSVDASRAFRDNQQSVQRNLTNDFVKQAIDMVNGVLADTYGYVPVGERQFLWILDSERHPEYATQQEAITAVKTLAKTMQASEPLDRLRADLQPLIEYFESLKTKYTKDEKPDRKMRYSAFFNLGKLYLLLDQPDKAIAEGEGLIKNDYDTGDGKRIIEEAQELKQKLAFHRLTERHMKL